MPDSASELQTLKWHKQKRKKKTPKINDSEEKLHNKVRPLNKKVYCLPLMRLQYVDFNNKIARMYFLHKQ